MFIRTLSRSYSPWVFHRKAIPSFCPGGKVGMSEGWAKSRSPPEPSPERQCAVRAQGLGPECLDSSHQSLAVWPQISSSAKSGEWAGLKRICVWSIGAEPCLQGTFQGVWSTLWIMKLEPRFPHSIPPFSLALMNE